MNKVYVLLEYFDEWLDDANFCIKLSIGRIVNSSSSV